ncbi:MAG: FAD binding domain-containing protein [Deltaproteobacteria bacterium]|nr:MAG: FAD binding domain-containing protein [Deltaproteobacteria bacterium]
MKSFNHVDAKTVTEAVKLLKKNRGRAKLIAGGTDLLSTLKDKILPAYPEAIVNIKTIPKLNHISEDGGGLKIGALAKLEEIAQSPVVKEKYKLLAEAAEAVATPQIRRMGTIGGNLCQDVRCWYYRYPHSVGGRILCYLKGGKGCYALPRESQYHSIFGGWRDTSPPCSLACPGGVDIPSYLSQVREGDLPQAARTLLNTNPLPSVTGRVCPHFCEQECNRGDFDESVSVRDIERFMGDYILDKADEIIKAPGTDTGKSVAIIGSGPAGLSAAYYLRMSGHRVTVFDKMEEAGGMLAYVIPAYRLPKDIVKRVVKAIENTGVEFKCKVDVGRDITLDDLKRDFDSVFIANGAWNPVSIGLEGEESTRFGMEFLTNINLGVKEIPGKKVLVIGGGNAAVDVAVSALRLGAEEATIACLECREEMPALPWEIELAVEQGVKLMTSWGPHRVLKADDKVTGMELIRCTAVFDEQGCFAPTFDSAVKQTVEADQILLAVGYDTDLTFIDPATPLKVEQGLITVDPETQATSVPGVFAGGSVTHGPATVIEAIAAGRRAAAAMNVYLRGKAQAKDKDEKTAQPFLRFNSDYLKKTSRVTMPKRPVAERSITVEDTLGLGLSEIEGEANRCFNCGCVSVSSSDMGVVLVALGARVEIAGPKGTRTVPIEDFFGSLRTILESDEMVTEIQVPRPPDGARQTFLKFRLRESVDFPIVSVASVITVDGGVCQDARIVLGAVAPSPVQATTAEKVLIGRAIDDGQATAAAQAALENAIPLEKNSYKVTIARELVRRAILPPESSGEMR